MALSEKLIYTITTIRPFLGDSNRAVGFAYDFEKADEWLRNNVMSLNECGHYPYAVIEPIQEGIYMYSREEHWYKFDREKEKYEPCEKPDRFKQVIGWSLG